MKIIGYNEKGYELVQLEGCDTVVDCPDFFKGVDPSLDVYQKHVSFMVDLAGQGDDRMIFVEVDIDILKKIVDAWDNDIKKVYFDEDGNPIYFNDEKGHFDYTRDDALTEKYGFFVSSDGREDNLIREE